MIVALAIAAVLQPGPGPIDAFRANLASTSVGVKFNYNLYPGVDSSILEKLSEFSAVPEPGGEPVHVINGQWDFDGSVEHYVGHTIATDGKERSYELLFDGETAAAHYFDDVIDVHTTNSPALPPHGPLAWWGGNSFPRILELSYPDIRPVRRRAVRGGFHTEVEIYRKPHPGGWSQVEVFYDPGLGYLPRYVRGISVGSSKKGWVKETYLIEARPCASGGLVPTEWFETAFHVDDFLARYPDYDEDTTLVPSGSVTLGHFKVVSFEDRSTPPRLEHLDTIRMIASADAAAPLKSPPGPLTMSEVKAILRKSGTTIHRPPTANIDTAEMNEFREPPEQRSWSRYVWAGLIAAMILGGLIMFWRGRRTLLIVLIGLSISAGCGSRSEPEVRLSAAFVQNRLIYDSANATIPMTLAIRNSGNVPTRIFNVDAGCSCRKVDRSRLPALLQPGENLNLSVQISDRQNYDPETVLFNFETNQGTLSVPVSFLALPSHRFIPASMTLVPNGDDESFEVIHREVFKRDAPGPQLTLSIPPEFVATKIDTHSGLVGQAPEFAYRDTTYRMTLKDASLGLHKSSIVLRSPGAESQPAIELPVTWQRLPFLSSVPERVFLGSRPVRVFLRCPDEHVELTRVVSSPKGVEAVVSSIREVTVLLKDEAPPIIDGTIEVATSAAEQPPLKIPVIRYAPPVALSADQAQPKQRDKTDPR